MASDDEVDKIDEEASLEEELQEENEDAISESESDDEEEEQEEENEEELNLEELQESSLSGSEAASKNESAGFRINSLAESLGNSEYPITKFISPRKNSIIHQHI